MIAFHFPPFRGSSGIQRTLKFCQYLPRHGWTPIVLSASPVAFPRVGDDLLADIPADLEVARPFALDTARHLAVRGRFPSAFAIPDRWVTWWLGAVPAGLRLIRRHRPDVLWSTYPIATAQLIGLTLHRLTGVPWIADFRDAMTEPDYPPGRATREVCRQIESAAVRRCAKAVFTAPGTLRMYAQRYPDVPDSRWRIIENGYDEESFSLAAHRAGEHRGDGKTFLVHSGVLYPAERDPLPFFDALAYLRDAGTASAASLKIVLRASGNEREYRGHLEQKGIADMVELAPPSNYAETLVEMMAADGLLLFQGSICNHQIPAKAYEYFRAGRPIFALTDPSGDTAALLRGMGIESIVRLDSREEIARGLTAFLDAIRNGTARAAGGEAARRHSRTSRTEELARLLGEVV